MKKLFALFLAFSLLFLTACNLTPPSNTTESNPSSSSSSDSAAPNTGQTAGNWQDTLKDQIVIKKNSGLMELPSRILFEANINQRTLTYYYSKADEKAYVYCFDPICDHTDYTCLASPNSYLSGWNFASMFFINNRFYCTTAYGQIWSFAFDGSDKRIEYDAGYELPDGVITNIWSIPPIVYGPYIYITLKADENGNRHTLRYNIETKEMEDLTEKTGNYISPLYFYNGMIYGSGESLKTGDTRFKVDLNLNTIEIDDNPVSPTYSVGDLMIGTVSERESIFDLPKLIGMEFYNIKTKARQVISKEELNMASLNIASVTREYIYFYEPKTINLGTTTVDRPDGSQLTMKVQKMNDGKLYRMNLDGTNIVCVYDNPDYELNDNMVIYEDRVVMQGQYVAIENGKKKVWGGPLQVAVINEDGTFGEFREVEVVG